MEVEVHTQHWMFFRDSSLRKSFSDFLELRSTPDYIQL